MRIGEMNKRITWQYPAKASNSMGGFTVTWRDVCETWARVLPTSAKEQRQTDQQVITVTHTITIKYRKPFLSSWRGYFRGRYFAIVSIVNPEERNEFLDILCKEVAG